MNIRPSLEEVRQIAAAGTYDVLPVSTEILSDFTTPIETLRILKNVSKHCFLLESALTRSWTSPAWAERSTACWTRAG